MVQNKQKSNKINIMALLSSFLVTIIFVVGVVDFVYASEPSDEIAKHDYYIRVCSVDNVKYESIYCYDLKDNGNNIPVAYFTGDSYGIVTKDSPIMYYNGEYWGEGRWNSLFNINSLSKFDYRYVGTFGSAVSFKDSNMLVFGSRNDALTYLDTGEINNPIYQPSIYDNTLPVPGNLSAATGNDTTVTDDFVLSDIGDITLNWDNPKEAGEEYKFNVSAKLSYIDEITGDIKQTDEVKIKAVDTVLKTITITNQDIIDACEGSDSLKLNDIIIYGYYTDKNGNYGDKIERHIPVSLNVTKSGSQTTVVYGEITPSFTVTIPKEIKLQDSEAGTKQDFTIKAKGDITGNKALSVSVTNQTINLKDANGKADTQAMVTLSQDTYDCTKLAGDGVDINGTLEAAETTAGNWTGQLQFNIALTVNNSAIK